MTLDDDRISNEVLREGFLCSGQSAHSVAKAVGLIRNGKRTKDKNRGDGTSLLRALGIAPDSSHGWRSYREYISYDLALKIAEQLDLDPTDVGL